MGDSRRALRRGFRAMINDPQLLELRPDSLERTDLLRGVKDNTIRVNFCFFRKSAIQLTLQLRLLRSIQAIHVQDQLVQLKRIIVDFANLELPRPNVIHVVQHVFEAIEIDKGSLDLVEVHLFHLGRA